MDRIQVGDITMAYRLFGTGHPLVLIMGLTANMDWWDPHLLDGLSSGYRVLIFDNRGAGRTDAPPGDFSIEQFADDTAGLIDAVGIQRAHVLGVSMGGMIAQELALNHPERVDRLVLCCTYCGGRETVFADRAVLVKLTDLSGTPEDKARRFLSLLFPPDWLADNEEYFAEFMRRYLVAPATDENAGRQFMATVRFDASDRLPRIGAPTLVACGADDALIPAENSRTIAERIPGARLVVYEGAGHGFINQCRGEFVDELTGFLG